MRYFKIEEKIIDFERKERGLPSDIPGVSGEAVPNGKYYFARIGEGEIIEDAPIFDFFHLKSFGPKKEWEWCIQDLHQLRGVGSIMTGWYISQPFKRLLEKCKIIGSYHFYQSKLLYKGEKLDYWFFQFTPDTVHNIIFPDSVFYLQNEDYIMERIYSYDEYLKVRRYYGRELDKELKVKLLCCKEPFDFCMDRVSGDKLASERLKNEIEDAGLMGVEFFDTSYEIKVLNT
ncbi:hypothetical protein [Pedobacter sp. SYSU D00535]|uniref:hypothetical protein n=1 Tax=Pedobacter sp. SYSU D00535 TaxID=2810308 RepID=UPI001A972E91|nr:hypothetical protein [Pedobacter sp. SYSU D00535]